MANIGNQNSFLPPQPPQQQRREANRRLGPLGILTMTLAVAGGAEAYSYPNGAPTRGVHKFGASNVPGFLDRRIETFSDHSPVMWERYPLSLDQSVYAINEKSQNWSRICGYETRDKNGVIEQGEFTKDGNLHGFGSRTLENGITLDGEFDNGVFVKGIKRYKDGGEDIGTFLNNILKGEDCIRIFPNGHRKIGTFDKNEWVSGILEWGPRVGGLLEGEDCLRIDKNGAEYRGRFVKDKIVFGEIRKGKEVWKGHFDDNVLNGENGEQTDRAGVVRSGQFVDGKLHGKGKTVFKDGMKEEGLYDAEDFVSGKVTFTDGRVDEGPRVLTDRGRVLEGPNCTSTIPGVKVSTGVFVGNDLVDGTIDYADGRKEIGTRKYDLLDGETCTRVLANQESLTGKFLKGKPEGFIKHTYPDGREETDFYVNGHLVTHGTTSRHVLESGVSCDDILTEANTPLLHTPESIAKVAKFMSNIDDVSNAAFDRFLSNIETHADKGRRLVESICVYKGIPRSVTGSDSSMMDHWETLSPTIEGMSFKSQVEFSFFVAQLRIYELGKTNVKQQFTREFKKMFEDDKTVLSGQRTMARYDVVPDLSPNKLGDTVAFSMFISSANTALKSHFPNMELFSDFSFEGGQFGFAPFLVNLDQYAPQYQAFLGTTGRDLPETLSPGAIY